MYISGLKSCSQDTQPRKHSEMPLAVGDANSLERSSNQADGSVLPSIVRHGVATLTTTLASMGHCEACAQVATPYRINRLDSMVTI